MSAARSLCMGAMALAVLAASAQKPAGFAVAAAAKTPASAAAPSPPAAGVPSTLKDVFGDTTAERGLEQSLSPYLTASSAGNSILLQPLTHAGPTGARRAFWLGRSMVVMTPAPMFENVAMTLPEGHWVNFWTGAQSMGSAPFTAELPAGTLPMWARAGSVIERRSGGYDGYFEKRLLTEAKACGDSCLFDLMPAFTQDDSAVTTDADGRTITRSLHRLAVSGKATRMTVRWRFTRVTDVRVNGATVPVQSSPEGYYASFDHAEASTVEWTVRDYMPRSY